MPSSVLLQPIGGMSGLDRRQDVSGKRGVGGSRTVHMAPEQLGNDATRKLRGGALGAPSPSDGMTDIYCSHCGHRMGARFKEADGIMFCLKCHGETRVFIKKL